MKTKRFLLAVMLLLSSPGLRASESTLTTVYQPLNPMVDRSVGVYSVPVVTGGSFPEMHFDAIAAPHIPVRFNAPPMGDINVASLAGLSLHCEAEMKPTGGLVKRYILTFDFTLAKPDLVNNELIDAVLECIAKTARKTPITTKMTGAEKFPAFVKRIQAKYPAEPDAKAGKPKAGKKP